MVKQQKVFAVDDSERAQNYILLTTQRLVSDKVLSEAPSTVTQQSSYTIADWITAEQQIIMALNNKSLDDPTKIQQIQDKITSMQAMVPLLFLQPTNVSVMTSSYSTFLDELEENENYNVNIKEGLTRPLLDLGTKLKFAVPSQQTAQQPMIINNAAPMKAMQGEIRSMKETTNNNIMVAEQKSQEMMRRIETLGDALNLSYKQTQTLLKGMASGKISKQTVAKAVDEIDPTDDQKEEILSVIEDPKFAIQVYNKSEKLFPTMHHQSREFEASDPIHSTVTPHKSNKKDPSTSIDRTDDSSKDFDNIPLDDDAQSFKSML